METIDVYTVYSPGSVMELSSDDEQPHNEIGDEDSDEDGNPLPLDYVFKRYSS